MVIVQVSISGPKGSGIARLDVDTGRGVVAVPLVTLGGLNALGQQRNNFIVQAHTLLPALPIEGVLGLDFFRAGRLVTDL